MAFSGFSVIIRTIRFATAALLVPAMLMLAVPLSHSEEEENSRRVRIIDGNDPPVSQPEAARRHSKVALVVGNSRYRQVPTLPNSQHDAADIAASLARLGFSVERVDDADFESMRRALLNFGRTAREAEIALLYFAGHGIEVDGENWLIPVDASLKSDWDIEQEAVPLRNVIPTVSVASKLGLVVLDACRNNPFTARMERRTRTRSVDRGLTRVEPSGSVLVAFAARHGTTASDGSGRNSPFTRALLRHLETPGLEVNFLFRHVRDDVMTETRGRQEPFLYGSLSREAIYLRPAQSPDVAVPVVLPAVPSPPLAAPVPQRPAAIAAPAPPVLAPSAPPAKPASTPRTTSQPGTKCFTLQGRRYCE